MKKIALWIITCLLIIGLSSCNSKKEKRAIEYLSQFERNESFNYVVQDIDIYTKNKQITIYEEELLEDSDILFVSKSSIYFSVRVEKNHYEVYKTDHDCSYSEKIFETCCSNIYMIDNDTIVYKDDENITKYSIKNDTYKQCDTTDFGEIFRNTEYYSLEIKKRKSHFFKTIKDFCITDINSQETKIINNEYLEELLKVEQAKYLNDLLKIEIRGITLVEDKIYVRCVSGEFPDFIVTVYSYDFENESFTFVDWVQIFDLEGFSMCFDGS
ncbi:MAG: hypothetical protein E7596_02140 [Ruminococcaceae bacterium]|nr:hypothetical protein [Oscillospiraceae bacterium]